MLVPSRLHAVLERTITTENDKNYIECQDRKVSLAITF